MTRAPTTMRRRDFIAAFGGAAALPFTAHAQQSMPVIGYFSSGLPAAQADNLAAFRKGLKDAGFVEGQNVAIEFRWARKSIRSATGDGGRSGPHDSRP